VVVYPKYLVQW